MNRFGVYLDVAIIKIVQFIFGSLLLIGCEIFLKEQNCVCVQFIIS